MTRLTYSSALIAGLIMVFCPTAVGLTAPITPVLGVIVTVLAVALIVNVYDPEP